MGVPRTVPGRAGAPVNQLHAELPWLVWARATLGIVFYAAPVAWLFFPRRLAWSYGAVAPALRWTAEALLVPLIAIFACSFTSLGTNYRGSVGLYERHELVTHGPYRFMKHPIHYTFIAIMLCVFFLSRNWLLGACGLTLVTMISSALRAQISATADWHRAAA